VQLLFVQIDQIYVYVVYFDVYCLFFPERLPIEHTCDT